MSASLEDGGGSKGSTKKNDAMNENSAVELSIRTRKRDLRMASSGSFLRGNLGHLRTNKADVLT